MKSEKAFQVYTIGSKLINNGELRLNASSYSINSIKADKILKNLKNKGYVIKKLGMLSSDIFSGARSKQIVISKKEGLPYLKPKEIFTFNLKPTKWISIETDDVENWGVSPFMILVTQSGSIGRPLLTNKLFDDKVVSPDTIRYAPNREGRELIGYIYAYLSTWIGQALIMRENFGITVKHIGDHHLSNLSIPLIPDLGEEINDEILKAHELREKSQKLFMEAESLLYSSLLPEIEEDDVNYFGGNKEI